MNDCEITTCVHYVYEWASNTKGVDRETGFHGKSGENGEFVGSACDYVYSWIF